MEPVNKTRYTQKFKISQIFVFILLIGTIIRIPIGQTATISFSEILLGLTVFLLPILSKNKVIKISKLNLKLLPIAMLIITVLLLQILINISRALSVLLLFEYLFIGIVLFFIFGRVKFSHKAYYKSLIVFSLYLGISSLYLNVLNYKVGNVTSILRFGSANYSSAIMLILIPIIYFYFRKNTYKKTNVLVYTSLLIMIINIVFSGSRSNIIVLLFQLFYFLLFIENSVTRKAKFIFAFLIITLIGYNIVVSINPELIFVIKRYLLFFGGSGDSRKDILYSDLARSIFKEEAILLIEENKLWGIGIARIPSSDIPVHNFVYEILLGLGFVGFFTYIIYAFNLFFLLYKQVKNTPLIMRLCFMLTISFFMISWVHPFMTTGKEFNFIFWLNIIAFYDYSEKTKNIT